MIGMWVVVEEVEEDFGCWSIEASNVNGFSSNAKGCVLLLHILGVLRIVLITTIERDQIGILIIIYTKRNAHLLDEDGHCFW